MLHRNQQIFLTQTRAQTPKYQQRDRYKFTRIYQNQILQKQSESQHCKNLTAKRFHSNLDIKQKKVDRNLNKFLRLHSSSDCDYNQNQSFYDFKKRKFPSYQLNLSQTLINETLIDTFENEQIEGKVQDKNNIDISIIQPPPQNSSRRMKKIFIALQKHNKKMMPSGAACNYNIQFMRGLQMTANRFNMQNQCPEMGLEFKTSKLEKNFYSELQKLKQLKKKSKRLNTISCDRQQSLNHTSLLSQSRYNTINQNQNHNYSYEKIQKIQSISVQEKQQSFRWVKIIDKMKNDIKLTQKRAFSLNEDLEERRQEKKLVKQYLVEEKKRMDYDALFLTRILINDKEQRWKKKQQIKIRDPSNNLKF